MIFRVLKKRWGMLSSVLLITVSTSAEPLSVHVNASSELPQAPAFLAADGDAAMPWIPADFSKENWIQFSFEEPKDVDVLELVWQGGINFCVYRVEVSDDGKTWNEVWRGKGEQSLSGAEVRLAHTVSASYVRIKTEGQRQGLSELKINGQSLLSPEATAIPAIPPNALYRNAALPPKERAGNVVSMMTDYEKMQMAGGYNNRYIRPLIRFGLRKVFMLDASAGVHLQPGFIEAPEPGSIAYPSSVALAATWNKALAKLYGATLGQECKSLGVDVLLGPGFNLYRTSSNGRNFEYMGEDPVLAGQMATSYIQGLQGEGVLAVAKHFICNNNEWRRHDVNVRVDERALHELYMLPWYQVVHDGGVGAIMGSYNWLNGEKVSCGPVALNGLLRGDVGFDGLIMSDWGAAWFSRDALRSGLDMSMPAMRNPVAFSATVSPGTQPQLDAVSERILTTLFRIGIYDRPQKIPQLASRRPEWETLALDAARESVTLLKNDDELPLVRTSGKVLVLGPSAGKTLHSGGGSGWVDGYGHTGIAGELARLLGLDVVDFEKNWKSINDEKIRSAESVVLCVDLPNREGIDIYPKLKDVQEMLVRRCVDLNPSTTVVVISGSGIEMDWNDKAAAVLWAYYPGQYGGRAIAEIITGKVNPSGKLPYTIERRFEDSPAYGYIPEGASWTQYKKTDVDDALPKRPPIEYTEGVFIGYRWYDEKRLDVRYPFGHGLSYTAFSYEDMKVVLGNEGILVTVTIRNTGGRAGKEVVQLYLGDNDASVARPVRELKDFTKVNLRPGEIKEVEFHLKPSALAFYDIEEKNWLVQPGEFNIEVGSSSRDIRLSKTIYWSKQLRYERPTDKQPVE